jgi:phospholipid/cholesterol/gamma-HCH transport system substrate-binding protein
MVIARVSVRQPTTEGPAMETRAPYTLIGLFVLTVIVAAFGFVYWLHNSGGLRERTVYRVQFENTVSGLLTGAAVLFNGIRVGEVTALELDVNNSNQVIAIIAVATTTPVRADTKAGLDFQGLTGVPVVTLQGGSVPLAASPGPNTQPYTLVADPLAGQSMTNAARDALKRLDSILSDNAEPIRSTIANLNTFSGALARNSDKLDGIVSGLARLTGGDGTSAVRVIYDLTVPTTFPPLSKVPEIQLTVAEPTSLIVFESRKIPIRPSGDEDSTFANAELSDSIPKLVQARIIQTFENAGLLRAVARPTDNVTADYQLVIDIRKFQILRREESIAEVAFAAKIVSAQGRIIEARLFQAGVPAKTLTAPAAAAALDEAFGKCATDLVLWTAGVM